MGAGWSRNDDDTTNNDVMFLMYLRIETLKKTILKRCQAKTLLCRKTQIKELRN